MTRVCGKRRRGGMHGERKRRKCDRIGARATHRRSVHPSADFRVSPAAVRRPLILAPAGELELRFHGVPEYLRLGLYDCDDCMDWEGGRGRGGARG